MNILLAPGDLISIVVLPTSPVSEFLRIGLPDPSASYQRFPGGASVTPSVIDLYTVNAYEVVKVDPSNYIIDNGGSGSPIPKIVGARPANITRR